MGEFLKLAEQLGKFVGVFEDIRDHLADISEAVQDHVYEWIEEGEGEEKPEAGVPAPEQAVG